MTTDPTLRVFFDEAYGLQETFEAGQAPRADIDACFEAVDDPAAVRIDGLEMYDPPSPAAATVTAPAGSAAARPWPRWIATPASCRSA